MGKIYESIDESLASWIERQKVFFVSTAPLAAAGRINCSPKGLDAFRILSPHQVAYADLNGSGIETAAHLRENGRILIMFCAFEGPPNIVRLHGTGRYHESGSDRHEALKAQFDIDGLRGIVEIDVTRISDSCGYGVPKYDFVEQRSALEKWSGKKSPAEIADYQANNNQQSIDGLPGLQSFGE